MTKYGRYLFAYKVKYYEPDEVQEHKYNLKKVHGVVYGDTYVDAVENVTRYYGDDQIEEMRITCADEACSAIELPHEAVQKIKHRYE